MRSRLDADQVFAGLLQVNIAGQQFDKGTHSVPFFIGPTVVDIKTFRFLLAFAFLAGLLAPNHYFPWPAFYNEAPVGVAFLPLAVYCLWANKCFQLPRYVWVLIALPFVPIFQWLFGLIYFGGDAWVSSLYLQGAVVAYIVGYVLSTSPRGLGGALLRWLAWLLLAGAFVSAIIALRQAFGLSGALWEMELRIGDRPYANLGQPNQLATLLVLGFLSALYLLVNKELDRVAFIAITLVLGGAFAAAQSRAALLSIVPLCIWINWRLRIAELRRDSARRDALGVLASFVLFWFLWPVLFEFWSVGGGVGPRAATDQARLLIWQQMIEAVLRAPMFGWGWGQVSFAQMDVVDSFRGVTNTESSHNLFLDLVVWNGVPIGLLMAFTISAWFMRRAYHCQTVDAWFALALIGAVLFHAMLEFPLNYAYFLLPVGMCVGIVDATSGVRTHYFPRLVYFVQIVIVATLFLGVVVEYPAAESRIRQVRFESMGIAKRDMASERDLAPLRVLTQIDAFIEFARSRAVEGMSSEELERMRIVSHRFPFPPSMFRYSLALALNGRIEEASLEMQRLRNLHGEKHYSEAKLNFVSLYGLHPKLSAMVLP